MAISLVRSNSIRATVTIFKTSHHLGSPGSPGLLAAGLVDDTTAPKSCTFAPCSSSLQFSVLCSPAQYEMNEQSELMVSVGDFVLFFQKKHYSSLSRAQKTAASPTISILC